MNQKMRASVWKLYFGNNEYGECFCCSKEIYQKASEAINTWNCGHIVSDHDGGNMIADNMRPICFKCNQLMKTQNLLEWKTTYYS